DSGTSERSHRLLGRKPSGEYSSRCARIGRNLFFLRLEPLLERLQLGGKPFELAAQRFHFGHRGGRGVRFRQANAHGLLQYVRRRILFCCVLRSSILYSVALGIETDNSTTD